LGIWLSLPARAGDYAIGADLSFLRQAEQAGTVFKEDGQARPGLEIFKDHGYNWVRLRLFHTSSRLPNNLEYTIASAQEARKLGFKFLLNYHYSDTWADPGKQFIPKAWEGKSHEELVKAVFEYTRDTIAAFRDAGAMPEMVQIGNEISNGVLWPDGKLPGNRGKGVFWWEPAVQGGLRSRGFFDDEGNALPVITVFDRFTRH
jgi:arabinogalactan endo-1,4-beta-galactosidase